jgi:hypothetical protein
VLIDRGTIRRSNGALASGANWDTVLVPTTRWSQNSQDIREWANPGPSAYGDASSRGFLARRSIKVPPGKLLIVGLFVYGLVGAPIIFWILRRRRPMAIWMVGPLLATLLTGFVVLVGGVNRQSSKDLQVVVFDTGEGAPSAIVEQARTKSAIVRLPPDWYRVTPSQSVDVGSAFAATFHSGRNPELQLGVLSGGVQTLRLRGPVESSTVPGAIEVAAKYGTRGTVTGTIRNTGKTIIQSARVLTPSLVADVGQLQPGESKDFTMIPDDGTPSTGNDPESAAARLELVEGSWQSGAQGSSVGLVTALAVVDPSSASSSGVPLKGPKTLAIAIAKTAPIVGLSRMLPVFVDGAEEVLRVDYAKDSPTFIDPFLPGSVWVDSDWQPWRSPNLPETSRADNVLVMRKG